ncbi:MAG: hypothetical protein AB7N76_08415 [Planctomycetota bacterium]
MPRHVLALLFAAWAALAGVASAQPTRDVSTLSEGTPPIVSTLGKDRVVELTAVNAGQGKVVWFNFALANEMGISLPRGQVLTPELESQLIREMAWQILPAGQEANGRATTKVYADRYGGWGMGYNKGAGRAAFFGQYNLNIKGIGVTPLVSNATSFSHRHGGAPLTEGVLEAVWGEVGTNLFNRGSTRILAVIDVGDVTKWEDGGSERRALIVRAGHQVRPAHVLAEGFQRPNTYEALVRMLDATNTLVKVSQPGGDVVDLNASLERLAQLHARTAAELYRYRILHGGLSPGNKSFDGGMLDLGTVTSQPRTAPVHVLDYTDTPNHVRDDLKFETENAWRVRDLEAYKQVLKEAAGKPGVRWQDMDVARVYEAEYRAQQELQLLEASGLKPEVARALRDADPELVKRYTQTLRRLGALTNPVEMNIERDKVERGSVADIFGALGGMPGVSFGEGDRTVETLKLLAIDADKRETRAKAEALGKELAELHKQVLETAWTQGGAHYDDRAAFERSVRERAAYENRPLDQLYRTELGKNIRELIAAYEKTGDPTELRRAMEGLISGGQRDVENLLGREARALQSGAIETGAEYHEGVRYAVEASPEGKRVLKVELPLEPVPGVGWRLSSLAAGDLSGADTESVRYRYTTDGWKTNAEVGGRVTQQGSDGKPALVFEVEVPAGKIAALEGAFRVGEHGAWINNGGRNYKGYELVVPDADDLERVRARIENPELDGRGGPGFGPGFAARRTGAEGPARMRWPRAGVDALFEKTKRGIKDLLAARAGELPEGERAAALRGAEKVGEAKLVVELSNDVDARVDPATNEVRITTGLLDALDAEAQKLPEAERGAFRAKALGLVLGHELAHSGGVDAERVADRIGLEAAGRLAGPLSEAEAKRTLRAVRGGGGLPLADRMRELLRYGTAGGREADLVRAARGEADPYAQFRRADGTLDWKRLSRSTAGREASGLLNFGMALFLKELAVVAKTGDRLRIEEFFDGLLTTDFYKQYGLFVAGARLGEVAYARYLERYIRPQFVNGILKTNLVLATGLALPQLVNGTFDGKAFAISLGSLGLSSAAVRAGVAGIEWVLDLKKTSAAAKAGELSRLARVGGWFYTAAELAVVLYLADEIEHRVNAWLDDRAARGALADAGLDFVKATNAPGADAAAVAAAAEKYHQAWSDYRAYLYRPLLADEARFAERAGKLARQAKLEADERQAAVDRLKATPALAANVIRRYGSIEAYADARAHEAEAGLDKDLSEAGRIYERDRAAHLKDAYEGGGREGALLAGLEHRDWLLSGAQPGAAGDPYATRSDVLARLGRSSAERGLTSALANASGNRLQSYADEAELLAEVERVLRAGGHGDAAAALAEARTRVEREHGLDERLYRNPGPVETRRGASQLLEGAGRGR